MLTNRPRYAENLMNGRWPDRLDVGKFAERAKMEKYLGSGEERDARSCRTKRRAHRRAKSVVFGV